MNIQTTVIAIVYKFHIHRQIWNCIMEIKVYLIILTVLVDNIIHMQAYADNKNDTANSAKGIYDLAKKQLIK